MAFINSPNLVSVESATLSAPPGTPVTGGLYLITSASPTGAWSGHAGQFARYDGSAWEYITPYEGTLVWAKDTPGIYQYKLGTASWYNYNTGAGGTPLTIQEADGSPLVTNVSTLKVANGTLTDDGGGVVTLTSFATALTVQEIDGTPSVPNVSTIKVTNGTLTDNGGGTVTITGTGTVTDVSVVTANGISGTVATSTSTPAITLDITNLSLAKLAALTASRALVSNGSGVISASSVTSTELGYVSGVTSSIQTQLGTKVSGTGTAGTIPKWASSTSLGDSILVELSGKIGVGGTPTQVLDVFGASRLGGNVTLSADNTYSLFSTTAMPSNTYSRKFATKKISDTNISTEFEFSFYNSTGTVNYQFYTAFVSPSTYQWGLYNPASGMDAITVNNTNTTIGGTLTTVGTISAGGNITPSATGFNLGTTNLPFKYLYLSGDGASPSTAYYKFTGTPTSGVRTITFPDISDTLVSLTATQTLTNKTLTTPVVSDTVTVGTVGGTTGAINLKGFTSGTVVVTTASAAGSWTMTLPTTSGSAGNFLTTNGSGVLSWSAAGGGTVTATGGSLTANYVVLGAGTTDTKVTAGITTDGTSKLNLGVAASSVGAVVFSNLTSGTVTLQPATGALGTSVVTIPTGTDTLVSLTAGQTLTNKTLTTPIIAAISNSGTITIPTGTDTLVGRATTDTLSNKSFANANVFYIDGTDATKKIGFQSSGATTGTTLTLASIATSNQTITFPAISDTVVTLTASQTLTNKTLTLPVITSISNAGTVTIPSGTDTLVNLASSQTLTNKTLSTGITVSAALTFTAGVKQTLSPNATNAGLNVGSFAGVPSTLSNGDIFYDSTAAALKARINGATVTLSTGGGTVTSFTFNNANGFTGSVTNSTSTPALTLDVSVGGLAVNRLATLTASRAVVTTSGGVLTTSAATDTEVSYLSGVTSAIQSQINTKQAADTTLTALAAYNTNGLITQTAADTFVGRTIVGTTNQVNVSNGDGVSGNPTLSLPQSIATSNTPQFAALGLGVAAPTVGLSIIGRTLNSDATGTVATADLTFAVTKNDALTKSYSGLRIKPTFNTAGGLNTTTTVDILQIDSTNTITTGLTVNLINALYGGTAFFTVTSAGSLTQTTLAKLASSTSTDLYNLLSTKTGSGLAVFGTAPTFASTIDVGTNGTAVGKINLKGSTSGTVGITVTSTPSNWNLTLPTGPGSSNNVLITDGTGVTSWATAATGTVTNTGGILTVNALMLGAGGVDSKVSTGITSDGVSKIMLGVSGTNVGCVAFNNATSGSITVQPPTGALGTIVLTLPSTAGNDNLVSRTSSDTLTNKTLTLPIIASISNSGTLTLPTGTDTLVGRATLDTLSNKTLTTPVISSSATIGTTGTASGSLSFKGVTSGTVNLSVANAAGSWTMTLPTSGGSAGNILTTDGAGVTSWTTASAGSVTSVSVVTANGISGSVATATTTPAITLDITALALSKLAALTANRAVATNGSGVLTVSSVTDTELGYLSGVTSALQTQLNNKSAIFTNSAGLAGLLSDETGTNKVVFSTAPTFDSTMNIGTVGGTTGKITFLGSTSGTVAITVNNTANTSGAWTLTLPQDAGINNYVLTTNGSGVTSWKSVTTIGAGGGDALTANPLNQFAATTSAQLAGVMSDEVGSSGGGLLVFNNSPSITAPTLTGLSTFSTRTLSTGSPTGTVGIIDASFTVDRNTTGTVTYPGMKILAILNTGMSNTTTTINLVDVDTTNTNTYGLTTNLMKLSYGGSQRLLVDSNGQLTLASGLILQGSTSQTVTVKAAATAGNWTMTLPGNSGTSGYVLSTDGSGGTSWINPTVGGTVTNVSVVTANGFSGTVATSTTTPAITIDASNLSLSKLAALTASRALVSSSGGVITVSATTDTEIGYVSGVTSAIQTQLNNKQALDATLTALAAYNTNGILTQTAADTFTGRTITGTTNQVIVTNGNGVSGNPTLSLPQDIATSSTPQFAGLGLGTTSPTAGITVVGKTLLSDATGTVGAADLSFSVTKNNSTASITYPGLKLKAILNTGGSNTTGVVDVLQIDTTNTSITGLTAINLINAMYGSVSKFVVTSAGNLTSTTLANLATSSSAQLRTLLSDSTGTGVTVFNNSPALTTPAITGGTISGLTSFGVRSTGTGAFDLKIANTENLTSSDKTLTITLNNAHRTLNLAGDFTTSGSFGLTLTQTGTTNVTLPTTGTLATLAGAETFSNKTLTLPIISDTATVGVTGTTSGKINFKGSGAASGTISLSSPTSPTTYTVTLPAAAPANGNILQSDGSGNLSWVAPAGGVSGSFTSGRIPYTTGSSALADTPNVLWDNTNRIATIGQQTNTNYAQLVVNGVAGATPSTTGTFYITGSGASGWLTGLTIHALSGSPNGMAIHTGLAGAPIILQGIVGSVGKVGIGADLNPSAQFQITMEASGTRPQIIKLASGHSVNAFEIQKNDSNIYSNFNQTGDLTLGSSATSHTGLLTLSGATSGTVGITVAATNTSYTLTLPSAAGTSGQYLKTTGSGTLVWDTPASGGGGGASIGSGTYASLPAAGTAGNAYMPTDGFSVLRDTGSVWQDWGPIQYLKPPRVASFAWVNQGTATATDYAGAIVMTCPTSSGENVRLLKKTLAASSNYTATVCVCPNLHGSNYKNTGLMLRESSSGKLIGLSIAIDGAVTGVYKLYVYEWTNATTFNTAATSFVLYSANEIWLRIVDDGTNRKYYVGTNKQDFIQVYSHGRTSYGTPDEIGIYINQAATDVTSSATFYHFEEA